MHQQINRKKPASPLLFLSQNNIPSTGKILHHGCGKDQPGTKLLNLKGVVTEYDINMPELNNPKSLEQVYNQVFSIFVLNCIPLNPRQKVIQKLSTISNSVFFAVRSQSDQNYKVK
ncbi:MAG: hypothetical protein DRH26_13205, partial [Deltaproteobacteria bacterium]